MLGEAQAEGGREPAILGTRIAQKLAQNPDTARGFKNLRTQLVLLLGLQPSSVITQNRPYIIT
jgi:hypothetical protein